MVRFSKSSPNVPSLSLLKGHQAELPMINQTLVHFRDERTYAIMVRTPGCAKIPKARIVI